mgnify:CR=1 FL=1
MLAAPLIGAVWVDEWVRGVIAPLAAFHLLGFFSLATLGWFCAALIVASPG